MRLVPRMAHEKEEEEERRRPVPIEVKAYRCSFCGRVYLTKKVESHEAKCFKNPARKACCTCGWEHGIGEKWAHENAAYGHDGYWCNHPLCPLRYHDRTMHAFERGQWEDCANLEYPASRVWMVEDLAYLTQDC